MITLKEDSLIEKIFALNSVLKIFPDSLLSPVLTEKIVLACVCNAYWYIKAWSGIILLLRT
jgi:hypothetical protein